MWVTHKNGRRVTHISHSDDTDEPTVACLFVCIQCVDLSAPVPKLHLKQGLKAQTYKRIYKGGKKSSHTSIFNLLFTEPLVQENQKRANSNLFFGSNHFLKGDIESLTHKVSIQEQHTSLDKAMQIMARHGIIAVINPWACFHALDKSNEENTHSHPHAHRCRRAWSNEHLINLTEAGLLHFHPAS